jgi:hypothetical protein
MHPLQVGKVSSTSDGKVLFNDLSNGKVYVFDDVLTLSKIEEKMAAGGVIKGTKALAMLGLLHKFISNHPAIHGVSGTIISSELAVPVEDKDEGKQIAITGNEMFFILVEDKEGPLDHKASRFYSWAEEQSGGPHPNYKDHKKYRIMPDQWKWLTNHEDCPVVAWLDLNIPLFPCLGCQTHQNMIRPILMGGVSGSPETAVQVAVEAQSLDIESEERVV